MFFIQTSNPKYTSEFDSDATTLDEIVESLFVLRTEDAIMHWSGVFIPMNYKYTVSSIIQDAIHLVSEILKSESGEHKIEWCSSDFHSIWKCIWEKDQLTIDSEWISVMGNTEKLLNKQSKLEVPVSTFLPEWKGLFQVIKKGLELSGYKSNAYENILEIETVCNQISGKGILYK